MTALQAFVICFIAYLLYKLMKPSGLPTEMIEKVKKEISVGVANIFKKTALENKVTLANLRNELHSGDSIRVEAAIKKIEAIFDKDITDADEVLEQFRTKSKDTPTSAQSGQ